MNAKPGEEDEVERTTSARRAPILEGADVRHGAAVAVPVDSRAAPVEVLGVTKIDAAVDRTARCA